MILLQVIYFTLMLVLSAGLMDFYRESGQQSQKMTTSFQKITQHLLQGQGPYQAPPPLTMSLRERLPYAPKK